MKEQLAPEEPVDRIEADSITVEIIDRNTGKAYRRRLPVQYFENSNGVVLSGESLDGSPVKLVFYSEAALAQISGLMGKGPDAPRCDHR